MEDDVNIQKNQIFTVKITDMGTDGEGIGHLEDSGALSGNGYTLFVKDAVLGDTVRAKVVKPKKGYAFARLEEVLEPSPDGGVTLPIWPFIIALSILSLVSLSIIWRKL